MISRTTPGMLDPGADYLLYGFFSPSTHSEANASLWDLEEDLLI